MTALAQGFISDAWSATESQRTHAKRLEILRERGVQEEAMAQVVDGCRQATAPANQQSK
jgi:hypothetical protein